jgi:hypothetical protein
MKMKMLVLFKEVLLLFLPILNSFCYVFKSGGAAAFDKISIQAVSPPFPSASATPSTRKSALRNRHYYDKVINYFQSELKKTKHQAKALGNLYHQTAGDDWKRAWRFLRSLTSRFSTLKMNQTTITSFLFNDSFFHFVLTRLQPQEDVEPLLKDKKKLREEMSQLHMSSRETSPAPGEE